MEQENGWYKFCHQMWCFRGHSTEHAVSPTDQSVHQCQGNPYIRPGRQSLLAKSYVHDRSQDHYHARDLQLADK